jgi:anti-sigma28 factor (negative regulator of flagellin synthesis)
MKQSDGIEGTQRYVGPTGASAASGLNGAGRTEIYTLPTPARSVQGSPSPAHEVHLSVTLCAEARAFAGTGVRADRIAALRRSITDNSYCVPSSDLADTLIRSLLMGRT